MTQEKRRALGRGLETLLPAVRSQGVAAVKEAERGLPADKPAGDKEAADKGAGAKEAGEKERGGKEAAGGAVMGAGTIGTVAGSAGDYALGHVEAQVARLKAEMTPVKTGEGELREIAMEQMEANPYQTRRKLKEEELEELAASIKMNGVIQPVVVRPVRGGRFQLIAGQRRMEAAKRAGKTHLPALVREVGDQQALEMTIVENLQREDLGPMEQARAYDRLAREFNVTQEQMAQRTGKDRATVANYLRLLKLPGEVQMELENNFKITFSHAKLLLTLETEEQIRKVAKAIVEQHLSVVQTEDLVFNVKNPVGKRAKPSRPVDPNIREAELSLERALGCRVRIKDRNGRGKIVIEYARLEDFDRVVEKLG